MRRLVILALVLAGCGGATADTTATTTAPPTTTTTTAPRVVVTSDDGMVTIEAALADDPGITITRLTEDAYPATFAALAGTDAAVYALAPVGLAFATPATITFTTAAADDLAETEIPVSTIVTTDGAAVELLGDLAVTRDGDTVTVSGSIEHFTGMAVITEQIVVEASIVEVTRDFVSEIGVDFRITPRVGDADAFPGSATPFGTSPHADFTGDGTDLIMRCREIGTMPGDIGWDTVFGVDLARLALTTPIPTIGVGLRLRFRPQINCTGDVVTGIQIDYSDVVDHPDGELIIPGENFLDGGSGLAGTISASGIGDLALGLICDLDQNGKVDGTDWMYPPYLTTGTVDARQFVLPLYGYADYFVYVLRPGDFSGFDSLGLGGSTVMTQVPLLGDLYRGAGRLESSVGVVSIDKLPFVRRVFADEDRAARIAELLVFITPGILTHTE